MAHKKSVKRKEIITNTVYLNTPDEGIRYAKDVIAGKIIASIPVKQACQRFFDDIKRFKSKDSKYIYKDDWAKHFLNFTNRFIKHVRGPMSNQLFKLEPWQVFLVLNIFGFVERKNNNIRRFKNVLLFIARKNGKSFFSSVLPIYLMLVSNDDGQEIYSAATQRSQAKIVWEVAGRIIDKLPDELRKVFTKTISHIKIHSKFATYAPLGRDSKNLDGLNPSLIVFDEAAAITDRNVVEVLTSGVGSRDNYLNLFITTASTTRTTILYDNYLYCKKILAGDIVDDKWLALIYELDEIGEADDIKTWIKANPNMEVSVNKEFMQSEYLEASNQPTKKANFLVKHLNVWQSSASVWLDINILRANYISEINTGGACYVGVDLGGVSDLTSLMFIFCNGSSFHTENICMLPKESMKRIPKHLTAVYGNAVQAGELILTEGAVTNVDGVVEFILTHAHDLGYNIKLVAYDSWQAMSLERLLDESDVENLGVAQTLVKLSPTALEVERLYIDGKLQQKENSFYEWQFGNVHKHTDVNGNIKLRKGDDSSAKVDAVIALNIGMVAALQHADDVVIGAFA